MFKEVLQQTLQALELSGTILYPTDTVWGLGCDATDPVAVAKIYKIKNREESKSLILLVSSLHMLQRYVKAIPKAALEILDKAQNPTTIIYRNPEGLAKNTIASDQTIAIRIVKSGFCHELIRRFDKPIVSTSANTSGKTTPKSFSEISPAILESVDYVVALHQNKTAEKPSTILRITEAGDIAILRE
jgi:L-threonylcarbamoyladenylate synthase